MDAHVMTIEENERQFDSEWVLIADPVVNNDNDVLGGKVLSHSKDRDELDRVLLKVRPKVSAVVFTGSLPEGVALVL